MKAFLMTFTMFGMLAETGTAEYLKHAQILGGADTRIEQIRKGDAKLVLADSKGKALPAGTKVEIEQVKHQFLFGCNIFKLFNCETPEQNTAYEKLFSELFNFATLPFYWWAYERTADTNLDDTTDRIIKWCREHNITPKGHPLAWNYVDPKWLPDDPKASMDIQMARIGKCMKRFEKDILLWDVVNEAVEHDRPDLKKNSPKLTEAIRLMGVPAYVTQAFSEARKANPNANLIINDYCTDQKYENLVLSKLVDKSGKPSYDIIGIQSHMHGGYWVPEKTWYTCESFAKLNKPIHFTEATILSNIKTEKGWEVNSESEAKQAREVVEFYTILFSNPMVEAITWWDFSDQGAWMAAPAGFLRKDMTPKPAYEELKKLIKGKWWTKAQVRTQENGNVNFRGFYGQYRVKATIAGKNVEGIVEFKKGDTTPISVKME